MIPIIILLFSGMALVQFFVSFCRSILLSYDKAEVSSRTREVAGLSEGLIAGGEFNHLLGLVRLAHDPGDDHVELKTVTTYYRVLRIVNAVAGPFASTVKEWVNAECNRCAYFAAVTLDRRITPVPH